MAGGTEDCNGHRARDRADEPEDDHPAHAGPGAVAEEHHADDAGHDGLADDEGGGGAVDGAEL